jgi:hypothetical protein
MYAAMPRRSFVPNGHRKAADDLGPAMIATIAINSSIVDNLVCDQYVF